MPGDFDVQSETVSGGTEVLHVTGELDLATAPRLEEIIGATSSDLVVVDLTGCTFLDSSGVRTLVACARQLSEGGDRSLRLVTGGASIARVLEITGIDTLVPVHSSLEAAL